MSEKDIIKNITKNVDAEIRGGSESGAGKGNKKGQNGEALKSQPKGGSNTKPRPKRGRPQKKPNPVNEQNKQVSFTQQRMQDQKISLDMIQQRWGSVFGKYSSLGADALASAWAQGWGQLNNPFLQNYRIKQILAQPRKLDQDDLADMVNDPENHEVDLSGVSMGMYYKNYVYNFLVKLNRETPNYKTYAVPQYLNAEEMGKDSFKKESQKVDRILKAFKPALTLKTITTQVNLEGKSSYLPRISYDDDGEVNYFVMQKLNTDMVKLTGFGSKQQFITSFNMIVFLQPAYSVYQYPKYIQDVWADMNSRGIIQKDEKGNLQVNPLAELPKGHELEWTGKYYIYWVQLPQELCYTFYSDGAHPNAFPDTIGLFNDLNDLDDYRWLQANLLSKGVTSVLTAQVPLVKDPKPGADSTAISPDTVLGYTDLFGQTVSGNILPFFAPFTNYELHTLESQPEALDVIYDRTRDLIATSGNASLLPITDKPSIASVKSAQNIQASKSDYLTRQYEEFLNNFINSEFGLKNKWKIFIWGDIFNIRDDAKALKELVLTGMEGFLPKLLSVYDLTLEDYKSCVLYMDALGIKLKKTLDEDKMRLQSELTIKNTKEQAKISIKSEEQSQASTSSKVSIPDSNTRNTDTGMGNKVGRPKLNDDDIENDNTANSADAGTNVSDIKDYSLEFDDEVEDSTENRYNEGRCLICGKTLGGGEEVICSSCAETWAEIIAEGIEDYVPSKILLKDKQI